MFIRKYAYKNDQSQIQLYMFVFTTCVQGSVVIFVVYVANNGCTHVCFSWWIEIHMYLLSFLKIQNIITKPVYV